MQDANRYSTVTGGRPGLLADCTSYGVAGGKCRKNPGRFRSTYECTDGLSFVVGVSYWGEQLTFDPAVSVKIVDGIDKYLDDNGFKSVSEIVGALEI